jgi:[2-(trimethylamino)ethyl]phosphonate dioxygenase
LIDPILLDDGATLAIELEGQPRRFHAIWLRDNAQDETTRSPSNGQRLITLLDIPEGIRISEARWEGTSLRICFQPESRWISYDRDWLAAHGYDKPPPAAIGWTDEALVRWDSTAAAGVPVESYAAIRSDPDVLRRWLENLHRYGFARATGAPAETGTAEAVAALFGYVRETNYGRSFDVRSMVDPANLAYTNLGLQPHTDNPYRDPVPGLQILVGIDNSVEGGASLLIDGFKVAERLQAERPDGFTLLARHCARFEYAGTEGVRLRAKRPIIELGCDGELIAIRFNNRSAAPFADIPFAAMADYYAAYRHMATLIEDPSLAFRFRLAPGDLFVIDNQRILHARDAFSGGGNRWLQGCYVDRDGMLSTLAMLREIAR